MTPEKFKEPWPNESIIRLGEDLIYRTGYPIEEANEILTALRQHDLLCEIYFEARHYCTNIGDRAFARLLAAIKAVEDQP